MKKLLSIIVLLFLVTGSYNMMAQKSKQDEGKKGAKTADVKMVHSFLGKSAFNAGQISKWQFDSLLKQGVTAKDTGGRSYPVEGFTFSYAEKNLYEDSVGKLMVLTDFFSEYCPGDTVTLAIFRNIFYKTKPGDTAYFDNVKVRLPEGGQIIARPMKFVLTK